LGKETISAGVHIVAAINKNLEKEVKKDSFRENLLHYISVSIFSIPL